ncbi:MAG: TPM domain-containing protein [Ruminococcaceae bacterium]|nr:TPM domain-containing protein [Oscillospiraceae bacterium]
MKNNFFALCAAILMAVASFSVMADGENKRLNDLTEPTLLSESENAQISKKLDDISEKHGMDIVILAVDSTEEGLSVEEDATERYESMGFGDDGVMLYLSMEHGDWYILTCGFGITAITDAGIEYISEKFTDDLSDKNFAKAFDTFVSQTDEFIAQAKTGKPYGAGNMPKKPYNIILCIPVSVGIGFFASLIINNKWRSKLYSVSRKTKASNYVKPGSLVIDASRDFFLYKKIDRSERSDKGDDGSTTHTSSSGKTYGGGGGKF